LPIGTLSEIGAPLMPTIALKPPPTVVNNGQAAPEPQEVEQTEQPKIDVGGMELTDAQYDRLLNRALDRINELRSDMGIDGSGMAIENGWAWKREVNQRQYDNDWGWRKALGGIFAYSNFSLNISKRYARLMAAKTTDTLVGTDPFFSAMPTEHGSPDLAKEGEWYVQEQMTEVNAKKRLKEAQKTALIRNESVVKLSWVSNQTHFRGPVEVAVGPFAYDTPTGQQIFGEGQPIMTPKGKYIYRKDDVFEDPNVQGLLHLEKEPAVTFRHAIDQYHYFPDLDQTLEGPEGLDLRTLDFRDFLCPLKAASVHEADINVHLFDEQFERLQHQYRGFPLAEKYFKENVPGTNEGKTSGDQQPKTEKGEMEDASKVLRIVHCGDVYMRCNPFEGDPEDLGLESEIWLVLDVKNKKIIWADYLGNHMKKRPFEVIPGVELVQGRWYGVGVFEMLDHKQLYIDTQFNRVNFKSSKSSSVRFRSKNAVSQWKAGEKIVIGDNKILDIEDPRFDAKNPPLFQVNLTEIDEYAMKLIELMIQAGSTEVGIVGPDDAGMAGLDSQKLATGIKSLERTGNLLMKFTESDHADAITDILDQAVDIILEHMDEDEIAYKADTNELFNLNREEIRKLKKSVKLLLTKSRSTETIETARMVIQLCREYYEALTPFTRQKLRAEYLRQLKALEAPDADQLLAVVTDEEVAQWQAAQAKAANLPPKTSIATKFTDLERPEQEQVLQKEGITPAPAGALTSHQQQEVTQTDLEAKAKEKAKNLAPKPAPAAAPAKK
jgi:hypothetical protein